MAMACVPLLMGPHVTAAFLFPVAYMAFLVPFGDEHPVAANHHSPLDHPVRPPQPYSRTDRWRVHRHPAGLFEVAEACSGVKFLVAMIAFGALAANVLPLMAAPGGVHGGVRGGADHRQWHSRMGHGLCRADQGAAWAGGFDHIVYGWFFFAAVIAAIIGLAGAGSTGLSPIR
jgi:hypothetical protein